MRLRFGIVTNQLDMATVESAQSALFIAFGKVSKKVLCA